MTSIKKNKLHTGGKIFLNREVMTNKLDISSAPVTPFNSIYKTYQVALKDLR
jgi:hypothetical protein